MTGYVVYKYNYSTKKYERIKTIKNNGTLSYKASKLKSAMKHRFRIKAYVTDEGKTFYTAASTAKTTITRPAKIKKVKVKRSDKHRTLTVTVPAIARASGYYIQVATDKKMKNVVRTYKIKFGNVYSAEVHKLSKKKNYYARVRAYFKSGKTTVNGVYSPVKLSKKKKETKKKKKKEEESK